jgi:hypothetical protein
MKRLLLLLIACSMVSYCAAAQPTYAEQLGWDPGARVVIFHVDDAGMCHDANMGTIDAIENGVATSTSIMFPCPWITEIADYIATHPDMDAGIHLTLTSEWSVYRWEPLVGPTVAPGLVDPHGCLWPSVAEVIANAPASEVEAEIRAQIDRCLALGITPTHLDSHMGTLFSDPSYANVYLSIGIEKDIPILAAAGHLHYVSIENPALVDIARNLGEQAWVAGLPVLDDICTGLSTPDVVTTKANVISFLQTLLPGITEVILHCTHPSENFPFISASGPTREADTLAMLDPDVAQTITDEGIILTTWRELKTRRDAAKGLPSLTVPFLRSAPPGKRK